MSDLDQNRIAHLTMIQSVISRMATSSFAIKTLSITFASALVATLSAFTHPDWFFVAVILIVTSALGFMDAQYLRQEKLFRKLFDHVRLGQEHEAFCMDCSSFRSHVPSVFRLVFSWSIGAFYLAVLITVLFISYLIIHI